MACSLRSLRISWAATSVVVLSGRAGPARRGLRGSGRGRNGLEILSDGRDLLGLEIVAEARHPRRPAADVFAYQLLVAAERLARQRRRVLPRSLLHRGVADAARLAEQAQPQLLRVGERGVGRPLCVCRSRERDNERCNQNASHRACSEAELPPCLAAILLLTTTP